MLLYMAVESREGAGVVSCSEQRALCRGVVSMTQSAVFQKLWVRSSSSSGNVEVRLLPQHRESHRLQQSEMSRVK